jgi:hypothetical protein
VQDVSWHDARPREHPPRRAKGAAVLAGQGWTIGPIYDFAATTLSYHFFEGPFGFE